MLFRRKKPTAPAASGGATVTALPASRAGHAERVLRRLEWTVIRRWCSTP